MLYFADGRAAAGRGRWDEVRSERLDAGHFLLADGEPSSSSSDAVSLLAESSLSLRSRWTGFCAVDVDVAVAAGAELKPAKAVSARHAKLIVGFALNVTGNTACNELQLCHVTSGVREPGVQGGHLTPGN